MTKFISLIFFKKSVTKSTIFVTLFDSIEQKSSKKHIYEADKTKDLALIEELINRVKTIPVLLYLLRFEESAY